MKTLCLGIMVKNESLNIKRTLETVKPLINYWVIVDTGSTDNTIEIIKETMKDIPGELIERPWKDFGHNKSELLAFAKDKSNYLLILDADMIVKTDNFNKNTLIEDVYNILISWGVSYYMPLLINNRKTWKSIGVVHTYLQTEGHYTQKQLDTITILHDRIGVPREKGKRDIKILLDGLKEEPSNSRYMFYLAQAYKDEKDYQPAIEWYTKRINRGGWGEEIYYSYYIIGFCFEKLNKLDDAKKYYLKAWEYRPSRAESLYRLARIYRNLKDYNNAYLYAKKGLTISYPKDILFIEGSVYKYLLTFEKSISSYYLGYYKESYDDCTKIIQMDGVSEEIKNQTKLNQKFSEEKLKNV